MRAKTALEIVKTFCYKSNIPAPSALVSATTDPAALQLLHLLYATCEDLRSSVAWPQQKKTHAITLVSGQSDYDFPDDFYAPLLGTGWHRDASQRLIGPLSDAEYGYRLYGVASVSGDTAYAIMGSDLLDSISGSSPIKVSPTPTSSGEVISWFYQSANLFVPNRLWAPTTAYTVSQYAYTGENLYICTTAGTTSSTRPTSTGSAVTDGTVTWAFVSSSIEKAYEDGDYCIFDPDLVELGLEYFWKYEQGEEFEKAEANYRRKLNRAKARFGGSFVGNLDRYKRNFQRFTVPEGGWTL